MYEEEERRRRKTRRRLGTEHHWILTGVSTQADYFVTGEISKMI